MQPYGDAAGYEAYMGRWSLALAPNFLAFAAPAAASSILDIGCGTGSLLTALRAQYPDAHLVGVDPSASLLAQARTQAGLAAVDFIDATAEELPFADATFDGCLSLLVLQEFHGRPEPLASMRRVTRPGGVVAACQWDFPKMPVIATLVDALASLPGGASEQLAVTSSRHFNGEAELAAAWQAAGFSRVSTARLEVRRTYRDFDELWRTLLGGSTPSTLRLAALSGAEQQEVRSRMEQTLRPAQKAKGLELIAEALVVRGIA